MIPDELKERDQWVAWKYAHRDGETTKVPISADQYHGRGDSTNSNTWTDYETAVEYAEDHEGLGFVFSKSGPFVGIDLDDCRDPDTGEVEEWAREIIERFDSYTEVSPSGTGVHIIIQGIKPGDSCRTDVEGGHIEIYDHDRFFTITGNVL